MLMLKIYRVPMGRHIGGVYLTGMLCNSEYTDRQRPSVGVAYLV